MLSIQHLYDETFNYFHSHDFINIHHILVGYGIM